MTVETENSYSGPYTTDGATAAFPFSFDTTVDGDVAVILVDSEGTETTATGYSVTRTDGGGTVTFDTAPATGSSLFVILDPDFAQSTDFSAGGTYLASAHNAALDKAALRDIRIKRDLDRGLKTPLGEEGGTLPSLADRTGKFLAFSGVDGAPVAADGTDPEDILRPDLASTASGKGVELVAGAAKTVATRAAMKALTSAADKARPLFLSEDVPAVRGRMGTFLWSASNLASKVSADPSEGIYIAPTSDPTGASGAWVRQFDGPVNAAWFGAKGTGVAGAVDDTAALSAALDFVYSQNGGTLRIPAGDYLVTSIAKVWSSGISLVIEGESKMATILRKTGATTTPVLDLSTTVAPTSNYSVIRNLRVLGDAKTHDGIRLTNWARFNVENLHVSACNIGLDNRGSLVFMAYDVNLISNNTGYKADVANGVGANLVHFYGGVISANTTCAVDIRQAAGFSFHGTDMSGNGTAADTTTGAIRIRSSVDDETGVAHGSIKDCWFEANKGWSIYAEASELTLTIEDSLVIAAESGRSIYTGDIRNINLINVTCPTSGDTAEINAKNLIAIGGFIANITDNTTVSSAVFGARAQSGGTGIRAKKFNPRLGASTSYGDAPAMVSRTVNAVGNVGTGEDDLMTYTLPANAFSAIGQGLRVTAWGTTANNANAKTFKVYFAGTVLATLNLTASQAGTFRVDGEIMWRSGGLATCIFTLTEGGATTQSFAAHTTVTGITASASNIVKTTGEATADNDILQRGMVVEYLP